LVRLRRPTTSIIFATSSFAKTLPTASVFQMKLKNPRGACRPGTGVSPKRIGLRQSGVIARGDDPQEIVRRIADYRAQDRADSQYYAQYTVKKARLKTQLEASRSPAIEIEPVPTDDRGREP
jgi:hypothetical protein